ncbi:hypothetical protein [Mycobacteroides abscessus]|uniref:hypothetical protein n=1 Tax=Mycobacteroides abscessus TaxID=36809 RepID=UPI000E6A4B22|nr:hypothetical protein [Mycobacteroides abscessus]RIU33915.1 hypothetical protein D2E83_19530 [Mycobacteroides abscessus]
MNVKHIGAAVGVTAVLALPLAACGSTPPPAVTVTAASTTTYSSAPCPLITDPGWEACVDSHRAQRSAESSRSASASASASAAQAQRHQSSGIPAWAWFLIVPGLVILVLIVITIGGAFWEANETPRHAVRRDGAVWDELRRIEAVIDDDDDDEPESLLTYPAIPTPHAPEVVPYPESPSAPVAPAPSASLMDRLGK